MHVSTHVNKYVSLQVHKYQPQKIRQPLKMRLAQKIKRASKIKTTSNMKKKVVISGSVTLHKVFTPILAHIEPSEECQHTFPLRTKGCTRPNTRRKSAPIPQQEENFWGASASGAPKR